MKTIGKIAALAMTLSLAFVLTACGGSSSSSAASSASASASSASAAASSTSAAASSASTAASSAAASSAAASSSAEAPDTYRNEAFGIEFNLPEGWKFVDASSLKDMNSVVSSVTGNEGVDMIATNADGSTAVIVGIVEPSSETSGKTAEDFLKTQVDQLTQAMQGGNYAYTSTDAEITFNGRTRTLPANIASITVEGQTLVMGQAAAEKEGYFLDIAVVSTSEDAVMKTFEAFKAIAA